MIVSGIGRIFRDVESRVVGSTTVAKFGVVENKKIGEKEISTFLNVEAWGKQAEYVEKYASKGRRVYFNGELEQENWETKDGEKRSAFKVKLANLQFLDKQEVSNNEESDSENKSEDKDTPF